MTDGKLKSNTDELWNFFSEITTSADHLNEECDKYRRKLQWTEQKLQQKARQVDLKIDEISGEISAIKSQGEDEKLEDILARIAELQSQINTLEDQKSDIKRYLSYIYEYIELLQKEQSNYQYAFREGKKIINRYLKMVELTIAKTELSACKNPAAGEQYHEMNYRGSTFYCNDNSFDIKAVDSEGRTNLQRMEAGIAPIGKDGQAVELHHMLQSEKIGAIVEVSSSMHRKQHKALHINTNDIPSGITRSNFNVLRSAYWKRRAEFLKRENPNE